MRRRFIRLFAYLICISVLLSGTAYARVTEAQKVFTEGNTSTLWSLFKPDYRTYAVEADQSDVRIWCPDGPVFPAESDSDYAPANYTTVMLQEINGVGVTLDTFQTYFYDQRRKEFFLSDDSQFVFEGGTYLKPYGSHQVIVGRPRGGTGRYWVFVAAGTDDNGNDVEFYGIAEVLSVYSDASAQFGTDPEHDVGPLRHQADFEVEVANDVWWVPVVSLGQTRYTNTEIAQMVNLSPEEKQSSVSTLYEAMQLYRIGNFTSSEDNQRLFENGIDWEHHKPGYHAVRTNTGCCATSANWLNYILKDDYEEVGFIAYNQEDGSGHVFNYIKSDGFYYFIDMTQYRTDVSAGINADENGNPAAYRASNFIDANIHKATSVEAYIEYNRQKKNDPPSVYFTYQAEDCYAITSIIQGTSVYAEAMLYPASTKDTLTFYECDNFAGMGLAFHEGPVILPAWEEAKDAVYIVEEEYLAQLDPLTGYKAGDVLSLKEFGRDGTYATADGQDYSALPDDVGWFSFEGFFEMMGGGSNFCQHAEIHQNDLSFAEDMDSLCAGDLILDIPESLGQTEILRCVRDGNTLAVTDVYQNSHHLYEKIGLYRDEAGAWQPAEEVWYLIHISKDGQTRLFFTRFELRVQ